MADSSFRKLPGLGKAEEVKEAQSEWEAFAMLDAKGLEQYSQHSDLKYELLANEMSSSRPRSSSSR